MHNPRKLIKNLSDNQLKQLSKACGVTIGQLKTIGG